MVTAYYNRPRVTRAVLHKMFARHSGMVQEAARRAVTSRKKGKAALATHGRTLCAPTEKREARRECPLGEGIRVGEMGVTLRS